jgi:glutathione synthase/RimK-type ligase-like ATP-grasp enzyme
MIKNYNLFGFDFVFDRKGQIYFLEANSFPGLLRDQDKFYKKSVLEQISRDCNKSDNRLIVIYTKNDYEKYREAKYVSEKLAENTKIFKLVLLEEDELKNFSEKTLVNLDASSGLIFTPYRKVRDVLSGSDNYTIINSLEIADLTKDKFEISNLLNSNGINIPKTYLLSTYFESNSPDLLKGQKLIIKPIYGEKGNGIHKLDRDAVLEFINSLDKDEIDKNIIQDNIDVPLQDGRYWDIRSFVLNGRYMGSVKRVSNNFIVNVSLGGTTERVDSKLDKKVGEYSKLCSKIIINEMSLTE